MALKTSCGYLTINKFICWKTSIKKEVLQKALYHQHVSIEQGRLILSFLSLLSLRFYAHFCFYCLCLSDLGSTQNRVYLVMHMVEWNCLIVKMARPMCDVVFTPFSNLNWKSVSLSMIVLNIQSINLPRVGC